MLNLIRGSRTRRLIATAGTMAIMLGAAGCSGILDAELPGRIPTGLLDDATNAAVLGTSVVADFECAFSQYAASAAIFSDEYLGASGNASAKQWGTKNIPEGDPVNERAACTTIFGAYTPLHTARFQSEDVLTRLNGWTNEEAGIDLAPHRVRTMVLGAYSYALLGEGFCAMRLDHGTSILTPAQVLAVAETKFSAALTAATALPGAAGAELANLARVGRARVRIRLGNNSGAAADAAAVTPGFQYNVTRGADATSRYNDAFWALTEQRHGSVDPAYRDLQVGGVKDIRVDVRFGPDIGMQLKSFDGVTDLYVVNNKNLSREAPMRLASYVEAQLIQAEALGGQQAVDIINARRNQLSLPTYTGGTDEASVRALIISERLREFFMEGGHRLNDLIRFNIAWKTGNDQIGAPYGNLRCFPLPTSERIAAGG